MTVELWNKWFCVRAEGGIRKGFRLVISRIHCEKNLLRKISKSWVYKVFPRSRTPKRNTMMLRPGTLGWLNFHQRKSQRAMFASRCRTLGLHIVMLFGGQIRPDPPVLIGRLVPRPAIKFLLGKETTPAFILAFWMCTTEISYLGIWRLHLIMYIVTVISSLLLFLMMIIQRRQISNLHFDHADRHLPL